MQPAKPAQHGCKNDLSLRACPEADGLKATDGSLKRRRRAETAKRNTRRPTSPGQSVLKCEGERERSEEDRSDRDDEERCRQRLLLWALGALGTAG
uniref:Uncharacterized protein n=1 Tax=Knipowitschia caucasica TaxID=637954 RepID=A0AAV2MNF4_KNICA